MHLQDILTPERTLWGAPGSSKKRVLENIARFMSEHSHSLDPQQVFEHLIARERLGSTGLGSGIAIPHCRMPNCASIVGALIALESPIEFDAIDGEPVDILFVLLVPEQAHDQHLEVLSALAQRFSDPTYCTRLRTAGDSAALYLAAIS